MLRRSVLKRTHPTTLFAQVRTGPMRFILKFDSACNCRRSARTGVEAQVRREVARSILRATSTSRHATRESGRLRGAIQMTTNPTRSHRYDAIVIGARCAGAATAMLLARRGLRVLAV